MKKDLISRQAAIEATYDVLASYSYIDEPGSDVAERVENILKEMPSVQQKTGRWKTRSEGSLHYCSECGWALMDTESGEPPYMGTDFNRSNEERWTCCPGGCGWLMNFCPNCGADMREG